MVLPATVWDNSANYTEDDTSYGTDFFDTAGS